MKQTITINDIVEAIREDTGNPELMITEIVIGTQRFSAIGVPVLFVLEY